MAQCPKGLHVDLPSEGVAVETPRHEVASATFLVQPAFGHFDPGRTRHQVVRVLDPPVAERVRQSGAPRQSRRRTSAASPQSHWGGPPVPTGTRASPGSRPAQPVDRIELLEDAPCLGQPDVDQRVAIAVGQRIGQEPGKPCEGFAPERREDVRRLPHRHRDRRNLDARRGEKQQQAEFDCLGAV